MNYKKLLIPILAFTLIFAIAFSGCIKKNDTNDINTIYETQNNTNNTIDQIQTEENTQLDNEQTNVEENTTNNNNKVNITYCIIDMGEVTQEFWFSEEKARMYTQGKDNFTDKIIDKEKQCTRNEKGQNVCLPLEDSFDGLVEGWKITAQMAGTCNEEEVEYQIFNTE